MRWLLLLPLLLVACQPATKPDVLSESDAAVWRAVTTLQAQYRDLQAKDAEQETRSCKALYLSAFAAEKAGVLEAGWAAPILNEGWVIPGCPPWEELK